MHVRIARTLPRPLRKVCRIDHHIGEVVGLPMQRSGFVSMQQSAKISLVVQLGLGLEVEAGDVRFGLRCCEVRAFQSHNYGTIVDLLR